MYQSDLIPTAPKEICFMLTVFPTVLLATCFLWFLGVLSFPCDAWNRLNS